MADGVKDEVLLRLKIVGMMDGVEDEVLLQTTVVGGRVITFARHRTITIARHHRIIDRTSRIILTRMTEADRAAVVGLDLVQVLAMTLVAQMNLVAAQDNRSTNTNQGMIGTTRIDAITERGTRMAETDDMAILRDAMITTGNKIDTVVGDTIETDETETSRVNT
jgi:hypothetical protein